MKLFKSSYFLFALCTTFLSFTGCIDDSELDFPEDRSNEIVQSLEVYSLINFIEQSHDIECFSIVFPIELAYSTGIIVEVDSGPGLTEAINSQSKSFYISGVILPILVDKGGVLASIKDLDELKELFLVCEVPELDRQLKNFRKQCFDFEYPITLIDEDTDVLIESESAFNNYLEEKGEDFLPLFKFPLNIKVFESDELVEIPDYYHLLQIINSCDQCPEAAIRINLEYNGSYTFDATYKKIGLPISYRWYLNNDLVGDGALNESNSLNMELEEGSYEICLKSFNPDCVEGSIFCRSFSVNKPCIEVFFNQERSNENPYLYHFYADFALQNDIGYEWVVFKGDNFLTSEAEIPGEGDNKFTFEFDPGFYTVCLEKENLNTACQLAKYCVELAIE